MTAAEPQTADAATAPGAAWAARAPELAAWALARLANRTDRCGGYYLDAEGKRRTTTRPPGGPEPGFVDAALLARHFRAAGPADLVGLHALGADGRGKWAAVDVDAHDGTGADEAANLRLVGEVWDRAAGLGLSPLLSKSDGRGGFHLLVLFAEPVPGPVLYEFGRWLVAGLDTGPGGPPETFPKQPAVGPGGYGNWLRVLGRHHTREHWAEVWDGEDWRSGADAAAHVLGLEGDDPSLIPFEALAAAAEPDPAPPPPPPPAAGPPGREGGRWEVLPGDEYNARGGAAAVRALLAADGWHRDREPGGGVEHWTRPGKGGGTSGTLGHCMGDGGLPLFYCWSSNAPGLAQHRAYSPFGLYAALRHGGEHSAAARALAADGYGRPAPAPAASGVIAAGAGANGTANGRHRPGGAAGAGAPTRGPEPRFEFLDADEFFAADYRPTWLVPRVLVRGQPAIVAGPSKALKTSLLVDLAVSLASGAPFLGAFPVAARARVALASGESGAHTLQETARRVAAARGVGDPAAALRGYFRPCFTLPTLSDLESVGAFEEALEAIAADVVVIDPFYLCLGGDVDEKSMFKMGAVLRAVTELIQRTGRTVVIAHHANGRLQTGEPMGLEHLAYSGGAQFARQWLLVNRRERYAGDGVHDLWLTTGGSAGHGGQWHVRVEEGVVGEDFAGRRWDVSVEPARDAFAAEAGAREAGRRQRGAARLAEDEADDTKVMAAIDASAAAGRGPVTARQLRELTHLGHAKITGCLTRLTTAGLLESFERTDRTGKGAGREQTVTVYRRPLG